MIHLIENAQTKAKGVVNLIDDNGVVLGFKPFPNGKPLHWCLKTNNDPKGTVYNEKTGIYAHEFLQGFDRNFGSILKLQANAHSSIPDPSSILLKDKSEELEIMFFDADGNLTDEVLTIAFNKDIGYYNVRFSLSYGDKAALAKIAGRNQKVVEFMKEHSFEENAMVNG